MPPTRNALYQRAYRARQGAAVSKKKAVDRILAGKIPQRTTLQRQGISEAEVNRLRATVDLPPLDFSLTPIRCLKKPECARVSATKIVPGRRSTGTQTSTAAATQTDPPQPASRAPTPQASRATVSTSTTTQANEEQDVESLASEMQNISLSGMTLRQVLERMKSEMRGANQIKPDGSPALDKAGNNKKLSDKSLENYLREMRLMGDATGCSEQVIFTACLRDAKQALLKLRARYKNKNTLKVKLNAIVTVSKYIPDFREAVGDEALDVYRREMLTTIREAEVEDEERAETTPGVPLSTLKQKAREINTKFGETTLDALAARLQIELVGIRDNLTGLRVVTSERAATQAGIQNYYVPRTKQLVIQKFKTRNSYDPYKFKVNEATAKLIAKSLKEKPRELLIGRSKVIDRVKRAFAAVGLPGVGVNVIRRSHISALIGGNPSAANVKRVAARFKHSPEMTLKYYRGENTEADL